MKPQNRKPEKSAYQYRQEVQKEINENKVNIDRSEFKKSPQEKAELKKLKKQVDKSQKLQTIFKG